MRGEREGDWCLALRGDGEGDWYAALRGDGEGDFCLVLRGDEDGLPFRVLSVTLASARDRCFGCADGFSGLLSDDSPSDFDCDSDSDELLEELSSELVSAFFLLFVTSFPIFGFSLTTSTCFTVSFGGVVSRFSLGDLILCLLPLIGDCDGNDLRFSLGELLDCSCLRLLRVFSMRCLSSDEGDLCLRATLSSLEKLRLRCLSSGVTARSTRPPSRLSLETTFSRCRVRRCPSASRESLLLPTLRICSGLVLDLRRLLSGSCSTASWRRIARFSSDGLRALRCLPCFLVTSGDFSAELDRSERRCRLSRTSFSWDWRFRLPRSSLTRLSRELPRSARDRS